MTFISGMSLVIFETSHLSQIRALWIILIKLWARSDPAVDAMHKAGGLPLVNALSESATDSIIVEHCTALLAKLDQRAANKV